MLVAVGHCRMDFQKLGTYVEWSLRNFHEPFFKNIKLCKRDLQNLRSPKYTNLSPKNEKYSVYIVRVSMPKLITN